MAQETAQLRALCAAVCHTGVHINYVDEFNRLAEERNRLTEARNFLVNSCNAMRQFIRRLELDLNDQDGLCRRLRDEKNYLEDDIRERLHANCIKALNHAFKQTTLAKFTVAMTAVKFAFPKFANEERNRWIPTMKKKERKIGQQKYVEVAYGRQAFGITFNSKGKLVNLTKNIALDVQQNLK